MIDHESRKKLLAELKEDQFTFSKKVRVGVNRGQYFVRIPTKISRMLDLEPDSEIEFVLKKSKGKTSVELLVRD
jgi:hypothetical protein